MLHLKEILMVVLSGAGVAAVAMFVAMADSLSAISLLVLAIFFWLLLVVLVIRDAVKRRRPSLYFFDQAKNEWVEIPHDAKRLPNLRSTVKLFDQDEEQHNDLKELA